MEKAVTQLFKRQSKNRAFFQNYRTFTLILDPPGKRRGRKPDPWGNWNVRIPGGGGWSGLELTDTLPLKLSL